MTAKFITERKTGNGMTILSDKNNPFVNRLGLGMVDQAGVARPECYANKPAFIEDGSTWAGTLPRLPLAWREFLSRWRWDWFVTVSYRGCPHPDLARRRLQKWLNQINRAIYGRRWYKRTRGVGFVLFPEQQYRGVVHHHVLLLGVEGLDRRFWQDRLWQLAGFSRVEQPLRQHAVARYVSKGIRWGNVEPEIGGSLFGDRQGTPLRYIVSSDAGAAAISVQE